MQTRKESSFISCGRSHPCDWGSQETEVTGVGWIIYIKLNSPRMMRISGEENYEPNTEVNDERGRSIQR